MSGLQALIHASVLYTGRGIREKDGRRIQMGDSDPIEDGALVHNEKKILWVGSTSDLPTRYRKVRKKSLQGKSAVLPGLIDAHTHLVFGGSRAEEFGKRCSGTTYEEIAQAGGGIQATVRATKLASEDELFEIAAARVRESMSYGVRVIEAKSGYGLDHATELKQLRVVKRLKRAFPGVRLVSTYLGAHDYPRDRSREAYLTEILDQTLPEIARKRLADQCDVFMDRGYFEAPETEKILVRAKKLGLQIKLHGDELANTEAATLGCKLGALSVDHLLKVSEGGIRALGSSRTVALLLPGTAFYLRAPHAPARKLIEAGAKVAIASDFNPGSCFSLNLPAILTISALYLGMNRDELLAAVTYNAASALGLEAEYGTLAPGMAASFTVAPFATFEEMYYRFAWSGQPVRGSRP